MKTVIISLNSVNQLIFVMVKMCFLCGMDWILKYYLDEFRLQRVKFLGNHGNHLQDYMAS
jgi:hypothetical protein